MFDRTKTIHMKKAIQLTGGLFMILCACSEDKEGITKELDQLELNGFAAVPMPNRLITGDAFPTDSTKILFWADNSHVVNHLETNVDIIDHGWAIWDALTEMTDEKHDGQQLRRFDTWYSPDDIKEAYSRRGESKAVNLKHVQRKRGKLKTPGQFHQGTNTEALTSHEAGIKVMVKFDPSAAQHIYDNDLLYEKTIKGMLKNGEIANIPDFPTSGVSIKPVYQPLTAQNPDGTYDLQVWPGNGGDDARPFGMNAWQTSVKITLTGKTDVGKGIYSIDEFIHFQIDTDQVASIEGAEVGDYAVLAAMHVTTREISRWTWQTYWWSVDNNAPFSPSSDEIAFRRPIDKLDKASNHYAMSMAYSMIGPAQPINGGSGQVEGATSLYTYNPYLEAGFKPSDAAFIAGNKVIEDAYGKEVQMVGTQFNDYGMQTNCMTCHGQARYTGTLNEMFYIGDQYFESDSKYFKSTVKLDFSWAVALNMIPDKSVKKESKY
ncbi:MAG: hypothetical protein ACJA0U_002193 [Salibacteraceae bacterium]|jgi:hypothetical protein